MPKLKLEDLAEVREKARKAISLRDGAARVRMTVHMGTCGLAAGSGRSLRLPCGKWSRGISGTLW